MSSDGACFYYGYTKRWGRSWGSLHQHIRGRSTTGPFSKIRVMVVAVESKGTSCNFPSTSNTLPSLTEVLQSLASCLKCSTGPVHHRCNTKAVCELMRVRDKESFFSPLLWKMLKMIFFLLEKAWVCNSIFTLAVVLYWTTKDDFFFKEIEISAEVERTHDEIRYYSQYSCYMDILSDSEVHFFPITNWTQWKKFCQTDKNSVFQKYS